MELVTAAEMRDLDRAAITELKISSFRLMEQAGKAVVRAMERRFDPLRGKTVTIVVGKGQNGGDGLVVARLLRKKGCTAQVALLFPPSAITGDAAVNLKRLQQGGNRSKIVTYAADFDTTLRALFQRSDVLVDAIFGTGLNAPVTGRAWRVITLMNDFGRPIIAIDLPSGLDSDNGSVLGTAITAALTVTMTRPKRGLYLGVGPNHAGLIRVADIGIPDALVAAAKIPVTLLQAGDIRPLLPQRPRTAHKGTCGHAGVIAGSPGKTGAAAMTAMAALRSGAGLVTVAAPRGICDILEAKLLEAMVVPVPETDQRAFSTKALPALLAFAADKTALAVGPGIGTDPDTQTLVHRLLVKTTRPMVLDADGLNAIAGHRDLLNRASSPLILTPHPGEMARLLETTSAEIQRDRLGAASRLAHGHNVYVVLKGAGTIIAAPDGRLAVNSTGNPGMATAGAGDVLTGLIAGLLAQGLAPWDAACAGAFLHGLAGDLAVTEQGEAGMIAGDIIQSIPRAIQRILSHSTTTT